MKLKKISLRSLNDNEMRKQEQSHLLGGTECGCGCNGSSSYSSNLSANYAHGYYPGHSCVYAEYDGSNTEFIVQPHAY